jgi:hypothetical protein
MGLPPLFRIFLNQIKRHDNPSSAAKPHGLAGKNGKTPSGRDFRRRRVGMHMRLDVSVGLSFQIICQSICGVGMALAVRAAGAAGLGAGSERLVEDLLDGACAAAAFGAAAEAAIDLPGGARQGIRSRHGGADIMVGEDVAGTNDHEDRQDPVMLVVSDIEDAARMQKEKP